MYLYVELWSPKEAWKKLSQEERQAKMSELLQDFKDNPIVGVQPLHGPALIDPSVKRPTGFIYVAAWLVPKKDLIAKFEDRVDHLGWWWDYFDQKNAWGEMIKREDLLNHMVTLGKPKRQTLMERLSNIEAEVFARRKPIAVGKTPQKRRLKKKATRQRP
jgi:hypothetical protein